MKRQPQQVTPLPNPPMFPIIGIGTSAGGLEALELFLHHVPAGCGMAFVVIQHLSPTHSGNLPELLQRSTTMKVSQVDSTTKVQPDHVYVIPPNKDMSVSKRTLRLHVPEADTKHGLRLPIDSFLHSLAEDAAEQSIGIILSGMGSDGSNGLRTIKEQGGLTLAQEPASAKFDSMPRSAIDAGLVDIVAPAEELPARIIDFLGCATPRLKNEQDLRDNEQSSFEKITTLLKAKTRHDFSLYKPTSLYRRIERRMSIHKIDSIAKYAKFIQKNSHEVDLLFKELLIGVTSFFRDPAMWEELKSEALPKILEAYPDGGALRAWSCGCSTGEEAYSLAMSFTEALDQPILPGDYTLQIFATDLDADAVGKARRGLYYAAIEDNVSPERLQRFFIKEDNKYLIREEIREMVTFAQQNVVMDPPFTKLDILICRNLLIYLSTELQKKLMPLFHFSLKSGGLLFLGSAETIGSQSELFLPTHNRSKLYWRNNLLLRANSISFPSSFISNSQASLPQESLMLKSADNIQQLADNFILQHCSAPTVLATDQGDVVYISGKTGKYLEPAAGKANMNIFAMVREGLRYELGTAFSKALQQHEPVAVRGRLVDAHNYTQTVDMMFMRIEEPEALRGMVMIVFKDVSLLPKARRRKTGMLPDSKLVEELEQELLKSREETRTIREEMQTTHEELKSTNEELQSTNEELQSTNEELTTSKEEMQSMNEELQSVNAEQSTRLDEYIRVNNDMENLLNSTEIVTVFLDIHLQVRRYTTGANRLFKLIPSDVGRPLTDIVSDLNYPQLYDHVQDVLRKLISVENIVLTHDGRIFIVRIMPYRTMDKVIDGVVITCIDITAAKKIEHELLEKIAKLEAQLAG
ncbi:MAG: chemotaxis protein CheB [Desulfuromonadaceae bacterium]|nr:chemotaxis protein CheB [Desulfuromonadaceae bacterium]MDD5107138.1 chemotaxis protein CheB [Desulfuromonadaceae bacterium]